MTERRAGPDAVTRSTCTSPGETSPGWDLPGALDLSTLSPADVLAVAAARAGVDVAALSLDDRLAVARGVAAVLAASDPLPGPLDRRLQRALTAVVVALAAPCAA